MLSVACTITAIYNSMCALVAIYRDWLVVLLQASMQLACDNRHARARPAGRRRHEGTRRTKTSIVQIRIEVNLAVYKSTARKVRYLLC